MTVGRKAEMNGKAVNDIQRNISSSENLSSGISGRNYIQICPKESKNSSI
jgi:hypothetical protein